MGDFKELSRKSSIRSRVEHVFGIEEDEDSQWLSMVVPQGLRAE